MQIANIDKKEVRIIQYLGSKLQILDEIEREVECITPTNGIVCDLFAGSGVVSNRLSSKYTIYANDTQHYSETLLRVLMNGIKKETIPEYEDIVNSRYYKNNYKKLIEIFSEPLKYESVALKNDDYEMLRTLCELNLCYDGSLVTEEKKEQAKEIYGDAFYEFNIENINKLRNEKNLYALFSLYYSMSYFSLQQCIEIDSMRAAIDGFFDNREIDCNNRDFLLACLLHGISEIVSSVGKNFAQPIKVVDGKGNLKGFAIRRCMRDRKKKLKDSFIDIFDKISVISERKNNRVFCQDAYELLLSGKLKDVDTFYLDPPYTIDHYSRFYHIPETLVLYDYPELEKKKIKG